MRGPALNSHNMLGQLSESGVRRTRTRAFVAVVLPLVLITGCGDSGGSGGESGASAGGEVSASAASAPSASKARAAAQLDKLVLTGGDLKGFAVRKLKDVEVLSQHDVRTDEADCAVVGQAEWGVAMGEPVAIAQRRVDSGVDDDAIAAAGSDAEMDAAFTMTSTTVTLASYGSPDRARALLTALREGIAACDGGLSSLSVYEVIVDTAPTAGDEAVAFTVRSGEDDDTVGPTRAVVFRHGRVLAQFSTVNPAFSVSTDDFDVPAGLIEAQDAKLG